jgi:hypothetical protein
MAFDPCREWLGIDAVDLASPHVVLGVGPDESNPLVIAGAAEHRLRSLAAVTPGPFEKAHTALLIRVAEARDQMLAAAARRPPAPVVAPTVPVLSPPPPPRTVGLSAPPPPGGRPPVPPATPLPVPAVPVAPVTPVTPVMASPVPTAPDRAPLVPEPAPTPSMPPESAPPFVPPPVPSFGGSSIITGDDTGSPAWSGRPVAAPSNSGSGTVIAAMALLVAIAAGLGAYVMSTQGQQKVASRPPASHGGGNGSAKQPAAPMRPTAPKRAVGDDSGMEPPVTAGPAPQDDRPADEQDEMASREAEQRRLRSEEDARRERERREQEAAEKAGVEKERAAKEMAAREAAEREAREKAEREERERLERERVMAATKVEQSLRKALASLREGSYDAALKAVDAAKAAAGDDPEMDTRVERWRLLANYAKQLDRYRYEAIASANEGRDYQIGDRVVAVIEITSSTFVYKEAGQIRRGSRASLPKAIEHAILKQWFEKDGRAANHIFLGVNRLIDETPNLRIARSEWETALKGEPATRSLMPLLDDPILAGSN